MERKGKERKQVTKKTFEWLKLPVKMEETLSGLRFKTLDRGRAPWWTERE